MNNLVSELESIISSMPERINSLSDVEVKPKWLLKIKTFFWSSRIF
ncbi:MAG: hypothetical protein ACQEWW_09650 [Bacillota bacterium]